MASSVIWKKPCTSEFFNDEQNSVDLSVVKTAV